MNLNVERLKTYLGNLVVFKKGMKVEGTQVKGVVMPLAKSAAGVVMGDVEVPAESSFITMRKARVETKLDGLYKGAAIRKAKE